MKRILIHEDKKLFESIKKDLHSFYPLLVNMQKAYNGLEMGTFKSEVMEVLKAKGANPIEVDFNENIASQLNKSGITSSVIRQNMINGSAPLFLEFKSSFHDAKDFKINQPTGLNQRPTLEFNHISFDDKSQKFTIDQQSEKEILETYCRIYIDSEAEKSLYDSLVNFVNAQNQIKQSLQNVEYKFQREGYELQEIMEVFLNWDPKVSIKPDSIRYAINQKNILEQRRKLTDKIRANGN